MKDSLAVILVFLLVVLAFSSVYFGYTATHAKPISTVYSTLERNFTSYFTEFLTYNNTETVFPSTTETLTVNSTLVTVLTNTGRYYVYVLSSPSVCLPASTDPNFCYFFSYYLISSGTTITYSCTQQAAYGPDVCSADQVIYSPVTTITKTPYP